MLYHLLEYGFQRISRFPLVEIGLRELHEVQLPQIDAVPRDDAAAVRQLLRECCVRRAGLDAKNGARAGREVSLLNTLIAITGIYFEQGNADALFPCL